MPEPTAVIARRSLAPILARAAALVPIRTTVPGSILIERAGDELRLIVTDLTCWLGQTIATPAADWVGGAIDVHRFSDFVKSLPREAEIRLAANDGRLIVTAAGAEAAFTMIATADFRHFNIAASGEVTSEPAAQDLISALRFCLPAVADAREESRRFYFCGAFLASETGVVATDGNRLHHYPLPGLATPPGGVIVPTTAVKALLDLLRGTDKVLLAISPRTFAAAGSGWSLAARLIDGRFPGWSRVVPPLNARPALIDRAALKLAVARVVALAASDKTQGTGLCLEAGELVVRGGDGTAQVRTALSVSGGPDAAVSLLFKGEYLTDALDELTGDQVELHLPSDAHIAVTLRNSSSAGAAIIMPRAR